MKRPSGCCNACQRPIYGNNRSGVCYRCRRCWRCPVCYEQFPGKSQGTWCDGCAAIGRAIHAALTDRPVSPENGAPAVERGRLQAEQRAAVRALEGMTGD